MSLNTLKTFSGFIFKDLCLLSDIFLLIIEKGYGFSINTIKFVPN